MKKKHNNGKQNGKVGYKNPPKHSQFTSENQPSPDAKKRGWEERRAKQELFDKMWNCGEMTIKEAHEMRNDMKKNPQNYTVSEARMVRYMLDPKMTRDWLERNGVKATQNIKLDAEGVVNMDVTMKQITQKITDIIENTTHRKSKKNVQQKTKKISD